MWTLPNILTLSRILLIPVLVALLWCAPSPLHLWLAFALYVAMGITDYFDGALARAQASVSKLGTFLDPIADKFMVVAVLVVLVAVQSIRAVHVVAALVIVLREIGVSGLREFMAGEGHVMPVSRLAKWKTAAQMLALGALIFGGLPDADSAHAIGLALLWIAAVLTLVTGWAYLRTGFTAMQA